MFGAVNSKSGKTYICQRSSPVCKVYNKHVLTRALPACKATNHHGCCPQRGNIWESMRCPGRRPTSGSPRYAAPRTSSPWRTPYWRVVHRYLFCLQQAPQSNSTFPSSSLTDVTTTSSVGYLSPRDLPRRPGAIFPQLLDASRSEFHPAWRLRWRLRWRPRRHRWLLSPRGRGHPGCRRDARRQGDAHTGDSDRPRQGRLRRTVVVGDERRRSNEAVLWEQ